MFALSEVQIEIEEAEHPVLIVVITTPVGKLEVSGAFTQIGRVLRLNDAHVQGLSPGKLGRAGLNAIGAKLLVEADVDEIIIQGGARTTGEEAGKGPSAHPLPP